MIKRTKADKAFIAGYAIACAEIVRLHDAADDRRGRTSRLIPCGPVRYRFAESHYPSSAARVFFWAILAAGRQQLQCPRNRNCFRPRPRLTANASAIPIAQTRLSRHPSHPSPRALELLFR